MIQNYNRTVDNRNKQSYTLFIFSTIRCRITISRFNITKQATQGGDSIVTRLHLDEIRHTDIQFLCADFMNAAIKFYQSPTHQAAFEQWCGRRKEMKTMNSELVQRLREQYPNHIPLDVAAPLLGVSQRQLSKLIAAGREPFCLIGANIGIQQRYVRVYTERLIAYLNGELF